MDDSDHQMALLLQQQFEQESNKVNDVDLHVALQLQSQFSRESDVENPKGDIVYDRKNRSNDTRSLVDPSWELVDPTPDIHNLFVVYNERFFWNKLLSVCVSWSARMTSCAGVCSYSPKGGLCSITLSNPLLKLRPRKDLVETLLHEMIHAYLFVTHDNRDRDGHGPEFHKHMYRINKEAGTNITVFHDFHDEVRVYQQHWWKCDGPCQNWKPYFGMVRRAMNRAPGPNDRWWGEHSRTCGGTYIKVKEPEKKSKSNESSKPKKSANGSDIRNFIPVTSTNSNPKTAINKNLNNVPSSSKVNNIHGFANANGSLKVVPVFATGNIQGFSNLNKTPSGTKSNSSSTVVITKKPSTMTKTDDVSIKNPNILQPSPPYNVEDSSDYSAVRNHWLNKFGDAPAKRKSEDNSGEPKKIKVDSTNAFNNKENKTVNCPVCDKQVAESSLNKHLDLCLGRQGEQDLSTCFICNEKFPNSELQRHVSSCFECNFSDDSDLSVTECEICNVFVNHDEIAEHRKQCIENIFNANSQVGVESTTEVDLTKCENNDTFSANKIVDHGKQRVENLFKSDSQGSTLCANTNVTAFLSQCVVCEEMVNVDSLAKHTEHCLHKMFDEVEKKHNLLSSDEMVPCSVCGKRVLRSDMNAHLSECLKVCFDGEFDENISEFGNETVSPRHGIQVKS